MRRIGLVMMLALLGLVAWRPANAHKRGGHRRAKQGARLVGIAPTRRGGLIQKGGGGWGPMAPK
jgi:hypothetical protein